MATQYTRIYTFTGQRNTRERRNVAWTKFTVSGDTTHTIRQIVSITYEHYHTSTEKPTWALTGRLVLSDGTYIDSNIQSHKFSSDLYKYTNTFSTLPTVEQFAKITAVQTIANGTVEPTSASGGDLYWRATATEPMKVIVTFLEEPPTRYAPKVEKFELERVDADGSPANNGEYLSMTVKLSLQDASNKANSTVRIYVSTTPTVDTSSGNGITPNLTIDQMLSGINKNTQALSGHTFDDGFDYYFVLVFTCGKEMAVQPASIGRAFASLHISSCANGGVAIGGFSSSTDENAKFEVHHPAYLYGGIAQIGDGSQKTFEVVGIQAGSVTGQEVASGVTVDYDVKFDKPYAAAPHVVIGMMLGGKLAAHYGSGRVSCALISASATGFKVRAYNYTGLSDRPVIGFTWAAFGITA